MKHVTEEKLEYAPLIAGAQMPIVTKKVTVAQSAEVILRGTVLELDSSKKAKVAETAVYGIALHDIDATDSDVIAEIAVTGEFSLADLIFASDKTASDFEEKAESRNIYFRK